MDLEKNRSKVEKENVSHWEPMYIIKTQTNLKVVSL